MGTPVTDKHMSNQAIQFALFEFHVSCRINVTLLFLHTMEVKKKKQNVPLDREIKLDI